MTFKHFSNYIGAKLGKHWIIGYFIVHALFMIIIHQFFIDDHQTSNIYSILISIIFIYYLHNKYYKINLELEIKNDKNIINDLSTRKN